MLPPRVQCTACHSWCYALSATCYVRGTGLCTCVGASPQFEVGRDSGARRGSAAGVAAMRGCSRNSGDAAASPQLLAHRGPAAPDRSVATGATRMASRRLNAPALSVARQRQMPLGLRRSAAAAAAAAARQAGFRASEGRALRIHGALLRLPRAERMRSSTPATCPP
jgi:hypothetical protein